MVPAYHSPSSKEVIDTTGAGNAFLGGLAMGHAETGDWVTAAAYGVVSASFVVEQIGTPLVGTGEGREVWNGVVVGERLRGYLARLEGGGEGRAGS
jgi:bifunctional ADP-heptose synthase (sugar kinase/adenylyltransferase)